MTFPIRTLKSTKKLLPLLAMCMGTSAMVEAGPITYTINFNSQFGAAPTGSFTYNASTQQFANFFVQWDGIFFDLTSSALNPFDTGAGSPACLGNLTGGAAGFAWLSAGCQTFPISWTATVAPQRNNEVASFDFIEADGSPQIGISGVNAASAINGDTGEQGTFTITPQSSPNGVPEPGSLLLLAGGLGLLFCRSGRLKSR